MKKSMPTINKPKNFFILPNFVWQRSCKRGQKQIYLVMPSAAYFRIFAKIVQTRVETNLFDFAECRLFSHFCKDSAY